jgi:hypothetical protein
LGVVPDHEAGGAGADVGGRVVVEMGGAHEDCVGVLEEGKEGRC